MDAINEQPPSIDRERKRYRAFLLRIWCTADGNGRCWRASLEDSHTGERIGFGSLEELFGFLMQQSEPQRPEP